MFDFLKKKDSKTSDKRAPSGGSGGIQAELRTLGYEEQLARLAPGKAVAPHKTKGYTHNQTDPATTEAAFINQRLMPHVGIGADHQAQVDFSEQEVAHPKMRFSDDRTMAVQTEKRVSPRMFGRKEPAQAKEVYLTQPVAVTSNAQLVAAGSQVQLTPIGHTIAYEGRTLVGMRPIVREPLDAMVQFSEWIKTSICRDVAESVTGGSTRHQGQFVVRRGEPRTVTRLPANYEGSDRSNAAHDLAKSIAAPKDVRTDRAWGKGTKKGGAKVRDAEAAGLNRAAAPEVGQAYGIFTIADVKAKDYVNHGGRVNPNAWGYHFAGVVAKSGDGADRVTLENFNRKDDLGKASYAAFKELEKTYKEEAIGAAQYVKELYVGAPTSLLPALIAKISDPSALDTKIGSVTRQINEGGDKAWYFAMYGSHPGQTFHDVHGATAANPLTVAVDMHGPAV